MISRRVRNTVLLAASLVTIAKTFFPAAIGAPAPLHDACELLTQQQVSTALGVTVGPGSLIMGGSPRVCGWAEPQKAQQYARKVVVSLMTQYQYGTGKEPMRGVALNVVEGIGDEAYYVTAGAFGTGLTVRKGSVYFQVRVGGVPTDRLKEVERSLALQIIPRV